MDPRHRVVGAAVTCIALLGCGCGGGSPEPATTGAAAVAAALPKTDPQNLYDCLAQAHASVSIDPAATPRSFLSAARAARAVRDGTAAMAARFSDDTRAQYDVWGSAAKAGAEAKAAHGEARDNVVVCLLGRRTARPGGRRHQGVRPPLSGAHALRSRAGAQPRLASRSTNSAAIASGGRSPSASINTPRSR